MNPSNFFYFAYGSNMNPERIRLRIPEARPLGRATLKGWRVAERLYADIEKARGGRVEGVLYCVSETELRRLDAYEGYPRVYDCIPVSVYADLLGVGKPLYRVPAFTYVMTAETRKEREGKKYPEDYRITCAAGARYWNVKSAFGKLAPITPRQGWFHFGR